jgi:hypothetical protein
MTNSLKHLLETHLYATSCFVEILLDHVGNNVVEFATDTEAAWELLAPVLETHEGLQLFTALTGHTLAELEDELREELDLEEPED